MLRSGDEIGPYTLVNKLGKGAFGVVWLAERRTQITTTTAAIKIPLDDDIEIETIKHEADLWVRASGHPNVLPIIEANIYDEQIIIASEYAPDGSLDAYLKKHGKTPSVESAVEIVSGILAGLEHLHSRSIIHRDLKPANILFQGDTPRLADFGISRVLKSTSQSSNIMGTPSYMSPEAFDGKRNEQTDIWSVGVIFYQLLAGRLPFEQADITSLLGAILTRNPEPLPSNIPKPLQNVIARALAKDTSVRYKSATEMRKALRNPHETNPNFQPDKSIYTVQSPKNTFPPQDFHSPPTKKNNSPHFIYAIAGLLAVVIIVGGLIWMSDSETREISALELPTNNINTTSTPSTNNSVSATNQKEASVPVKISDKVINLESTRSGWQSIGNGYFTLEANGQIDFGGIKSTPQGVIRNGEGIKNALAPELPFGAIIAKIGGNGKPFLVGNRKDFNTQEQVYLAINDSDYSDNSGSFTIRIKYK